MPDRSQGWTSVRAPFSFVDGNDGGEVPVAGRFQPVDLLLDRSLDVVRGVG